MSYEKFLKEKILMPLYLIISVDFNTIPGSRCVAVDDDNAETMS